jgi:hypothetical protein
LEHGGIAHNLHASSQVLQGTGIAWEVNQLSAQPFCLHFAACIMMFHWHCKLNPCVRQHRLFDGTFATLDPSVDTNQLAVIWAGPPPNGPDQILLSLRNRLVRQNSKIK